MGPLLHLSSSSRDKRFLLESLTRADDVPASPKVLGQILGKGRRIVPVLTPLWLVDFHIPKKKKTVF